MGWSEVIGKSIDAANAEKGREANNEATAAQINATNTGNQLGLAFYNQNRADNLGSIVTGNSALAQLAKLYGLDTYTGAVNTTPITMTGGTATETGGSKWYDPGGFFAGHSSLSTTPTTISTGLGTGAGGSGGSGGGIQKGSGTPDYSSFFLSPDYQVRLNQGLQGLDRTAAARGRLYSGGQSSDVMNYAAGIGAQGFNDYTGRLLTLAGYGNQATNSVANTGANTASLVNQNLTNAGNARASGYTNNAAITGGFMSGIGDSISNWAGQRQGNNSGSAPSGGYGAFDPNNGSSGWNFNQGGWW